MDLVWSDSFQAYKVVDKLIEGKITWAIGYAAWVNCRSVPMSTKSLNEGMYCTGKNNNG